MRRHYGIHDPPLMASPSPSELRYFARVQGKTSGPFTARVLRELFAKDMIGANDFVAEEGSEDWRLAAEVLGLLAEEGTADVVPTGYNSPAQAKSSERRFRPLLISSMAAGLLILLGLAVLLSIGPRRAAKLDREIEILRARHDDGGLPALYQASLEGRLDLVSHLLKRGESPLGSVENESGEYPLHAAARSGQADVVMVLLNHGAKVDADDSKGGRPLHRAAAGGHLEATRILLAAGARLDHEDRYGYLPVHCAASGGDSDVVRLLREAGAELDAKTGPEKPMRSNRLERDPQVSSMLLRQGINPEDGEQPIHLAARRGHVEVVRYLLEQGIKPDAEDNNKRTPRDYAEQEGPLEGGRLEVVKLLDAAR